MNGARLCHDRFRPITGLTVLFTDVGFRNNRR